MINHRIRFGRWIYAILAVLFTFCLILQLLFAGLATFGNPEYWSNHATFVHFFGLNLPLFMFIFAWIGSLPKKTYWQLLSLVALIFTMYLTANLTVQVRWVGALHPVIAVVLTGLSCLHVSYIVKLIFGKDHQV